MPNFKCYPLTDPNSLWTYCPSYGAAILFICLFGLATLTHLILAIYYRKPFAWVIIMGGCWETAGYIFRALAVEDQLSDAFQTAQLLLILLAPLWINAFVYMTFGRMVHFYLQSDKVFFLKAKRITLIFVLFDISAFIVQAAGGSMTSSSEPVNIQLLGLHIYMGGVGLQLLYICVFLTLCVRFQLDVRGLEKSGQWIHLSDFASPRSARHLLYVLYTVLLLIIYRNIYRLIEFSSGVLSNITEHEWYAYVFDAVPMLFALIVFIIFHPGRVLRGPNSDFSEMRKREKAEKREKKQAKKTAKEEKRAAKVRVRGQEKEANQRRTQEKKKGKPTYFGGQHV